MTAFFTALNDDFMPGMRALLKSLLINNPWFDLDYLILTDGNLSDESIAELCNIYNKIKIIHVKKEDYSGCKDTIEKWNYNLFYRFDVFDLEHMNYDNIIMIDSDMLILKDISELLSLNSDFAACRKYPDMLPELNYLKKNFFNCGLMKLSKKIIKKIHKNNLINLANKKNWSSDQPLFNLYFHEKVTFLPENYNIVSSAVTKDTMKDIAILHFHGNSKPWMSSESKKCFSSFVFSLLSKAGEDLDEITSTLKNLYEKYK
jgi:lipopolysaccharide biosynthesis glycosyltransferase